MTIEIAEHIVDVGKDFNRYPAGRVDKDGEFNGTAFRQKHLLPFLRLGKKVVIVLDSAFVYGSSFLEEAFGGLVRDGVAREKIRSLVELKTQDVALKQEILSYVDSAKPR